MPRRNNREAPAPFWPPKDVTPSAAQQGVKWDGNGRRVKPMENPLHAVARQQESAERQRKARIEGSIDWSVCVVPGCGHEVADWNDAVTVLKSLRDPEVNLPLCREHAVIAWQQVQRHRHLPELMETAEQMAARHHREAELCKPPEPRDPDQPGELYFVRNNELVKVGWTETLERRLKEYGAGAELLCHFPGTPRDETALHRSLTPVRAKGREWYDDGPVIRRRVAKILKEFGPPTAEAKWTQPKNPVTIRYAEPAEPH